MADIFQKVSPRTALRLLGGVVGGLLILLMLLLLFIALFNWNNARGFVGRQIGARLQREVRIDGPLSLTVFSRTPSLEAHDLWIGNPDWAGEQPMAQVPRLLLIVSLGELLRLHLVFERIEVDAPKVALQRRADGKANWEFSTRSDSTSGTRVPTIRHFSLRDGALEFSDEAREFHLEGRLSADQDASKAATQGATGGSDEPFHLAGKGQVNGEAFDLNVDGGPLVNLRADQPYAFHVVMVSGENRGEVQGELATPFDLGHFTARVQAQGRNLAKLYAVTGLALPRTAAYRISAQVARDGGRFTIGDIMGRIGDSDMHGNATVNLRPDKRPLFSGVLASQSLRLVDLGIAFGAEGGTSGGGAGDATADVTGGGAKGKSVGLLFPATELKLNRLGVMDADIDYRAQSVQTVKMPLQGLSIKLLLQDGVLRLEPAVFTLPLGKLSGNLRIDSRVEPAAVTADLRLSGVKLEQFKKKDATNAPLQGTLEGHATLSGHGNSAHAVASSSSGRLTAVIPQGEIRDVLAELTGINVLRGLGLLLSNDQTTAKLRCGVAEFNVQGGVAQAGQMLFDTEHVQIKGDGRIDLRDETLHLELSGQPKSLRLVRLRAPIELSGTLLKPTVGVEAKSALKQGGIAAALSAITPLAAVLAFVDEGLAKDADCAALLADTDKAH